MNRYPPWKYAIIAAAMVLGFFFTLPNFFGEVPAVQVSPLRATLKADTALMSRVEQILGKGGFKPDAVFLDPQSVKARFADTDTQIRAKDVLQSQLGEDYIVALNLLSNSPDWLTAIGALPMYLGLDLRGGVHFLLQVDMRAALAKKVESLASDIRSGLREKRIQYTGIARTGQTLTIRFRDAATLERAIAELTRTVTDLALKGEETADGYRIIATLKPDAQRRTRDFALQQNITTLRNRVNELGVAEPIIQQQGADRVVVQLPGVQDTAKAKDILGRTATLEVRMVAEEHSDPATLQAAVAGQVPFGDELYYERGGVPILVRKQVVLTGDRINDAQPGFDQQTNEPAVHITLDGVGARIFQQVTRENVGKRMAILLFEKGKGEVVTAPVIRSEIGGGRVQISGRMNTQEARDIALLLRAGALAAPMEIIEERTVGPSLGAENIRVGFRSTWYGFGVLTVFMIAYYMLFGVFSVIALASNVLFLVALLSLLQATLTLPGMAGIALTLGMAIDANVLINERIREELRAGNTPQAAIHSGYDRAWGTILDSNITTLIAGLALFAFGSGPVKGFAVVLCLGILTSIFSAVVVSRGMVNLYYGSRRRLEGVSIGQVWKPAAQGK
ncbi:MAG: protein translocase subunit SecD [Betaproteobacteria bacterium]|nr:MAG: preprotein translocase subunit SecD [Betaproteobacteria bacterium SG8_41]UCF76482.1 MAG: protein translocase subunit SecD [Betaproteobacteria bacterium]